MTKDLLKGLNEHLKLEFRASHEYLAMSIWLSEHDLPGFATWMRKQSSDELMHAQRIIDHLVERDQKVALPAVSAPPMSWKSIGEWTLLAFTIGSPRRPWKWRAGTLWGRRPGSRCITCWAGR